MCFTLPLAGLSPTRANFLWRNNLFLTVFNSCTKPDTRWACMCVWQECLTLGGALSSCGSWPLGQGPFRPVASMKEGPSPALSSCHTELPLVVSLFALNHPQTRVQVGDRLTRSSGISLPPKEGPGCRMRSRMTIPESLGKGAVRTSGQARMEPGLGHDPRNH